MEKYNVIGEGLDLGYLHNVLSAIDNPITHVKKSRGNLITYKSKNKGDFTISQNNESFELSGKISTGLVKRLKEYGIELKESN